MNTEEAQALKQEETPPKSMAEAIMLDPGVPDSISDTLLFSGGGPVMLAINGALAGISLLSSLAKRYQPRFLKHIPVANKAFHNMRTTLHCDTLINVVAMVDAAITGQWVVAATALFGAYQNVPELAGIRHRDDENFAKSASFVKLAVNRKDLWLGLNYAFATLVVGGMSMASMVTLPFIALATVVGLKNIKDRKPECHKHPKMIIAAAFLAVGVASFFTGGGLILGLSTVVAAISFVANEVHVTPGGFKQVMKDCVTFDNYKYGFIPFMKKALNPKNIFKAALKTPKAVVKTPVVVMKAPVAMASSAKNSIAAKKLAKSTTPPRKLKKRDIRDTEVAAIGQLTEEGIYIGRFKDKDGKQRDYYAAPEDARGADGRGLMMTFNEAATYAQNAEILGHKDWTVPTSLTNKHDKSVAPDILAALFNNRNTGAFKDTFAKSGWYWSSTLKPFTEGDQNAAEVQNFGHHLARSYAYKQDRLRVRLVRSVEVAG